ncbi:hypothetical protein MTO96_036095 [Rhipicephalus appendiculatus]
MEHSLDALLTGESKEEVEIQVKKRITAQVWERATKDEENCGPKSYLGAGGLSLASAMGSAAPAATTHQVYPRAWRGFVDLPFTMKLSYTNERKER